MVVDHVFHRCAIDGGKPVIGIHGGGMVAPNAKLVDARYRLTGFGGNLAQGSVVVQAQHGGEVAGL